MKETPQLTYSELLKRLEEMSDAELAQPVMVRLYIAEETHEVVDFIPVTDERFTQQYMFGVEL